MSDIPDATGLERLRRLPPLKAVSIIRSGMDSGAVTMNIDGLLGFLLENAESCPRAVSLFDELGNTGIVQAFFEGFMSEPLECPECGNFTMFRQMQGARCQCGHVDRSVV